jgi:hypothetical protein
MNGEIEKPMGESRQRNDNKGNGAALRGGTRYEPNSSDSASAPGMPWVYGI